MSPWPALPFIQSSQSHWTHVLPTQFCLRAFVIATPSTRRNCLQDTRRTASLTSFIQISHTQWGLFWSPYIKLHSAAPTFSFPLHCFVSLYSICFITYYTSHLLFLSFTTCITPLETSSLRVGIFAWFCSLFFFSTCQSISICQMNESPLYKY